MRLHPATGLPYVTLLSRLPMSMVGRRLTKLHLICGAGTGLEFMRRLSHLGFRLSVGVVNVADSDQLDGALNLTRWRKRRSAPLRRKVTAATANSPARRCGRGDRPPFGRGNLPNPKRPPRVGRGPACAAGGRSAHRGADFAEGEAMALQRQILHAGAELYSDAEAVLAQLESLP